jgi:hypothetical protein
MRHTGCMLLARERLHRIVLGSRALLRLRMRRWISAFPRNGGERAFAKNVDDRRSACDRPSEWLDDRCDARA